MDLETGCYYHLYNRSNNCERLFRSSDNYLYFLDNFRDRFEGLLSVFAYCLMPTHFHFLIKVETRDVDQLKQHIGIQLNAYTKALNKVLGRHGSLFQQHTKAKLIDEQAYFRGLCETSHILSCCPPAGGSASHIQLLALKPRS